MKFRFVCDEVTMNKSIDMLELDQRAFNGLMRAGYDTIGKVVDNWEDLGKIRNLGKKSVSNIKSAIFGYNIQNLDDQGKLKRYLGRIIV